MAISLTFDSQGFYNDLMNELLKAMNDLINEFYREATSRLDGEGKNDTEIIPAYLSDTTEHDSYMPLGDVPEYIVAQCKFYADALMQSFGTGSLADTGPYSYWDEYVKSSFFNPLRNGTTIVGRKRGSYINIYGKKTSTWGSFAGKSIEGDVIAYRGEEAKIIEPSRGTYSIQNAEKWIIKDGETKIERRIETVVTKFITERAFSYFIQTSN